MSIAEQIKNIYLEYYNEMLAQGAWCGHMFAAEYLADQVKEAKQLFEQIKQDPVYPGVKGYVDASLFYLEDDYDDLIKKVFATDFSSHDRFVIANALDQAFLKQIDTVMCNLVSIYQELTGKEPDFFGENQSESA